MKYLKLPWITQISSYLGNFIMTFYQMFETFQIGLTCTPVQLCTVYVPCINVCCYPNINIESLYIMYWVHFDICTFY